MRFISEEEAIRQSKEISLRVYYTVTLNSLRSILDYTGLSGVITFLLMNIIPTPFTLNASILAFSTVFVIVSLHIGKQRLPLEQAVIKNPVISRNYPLIITLGTVLSLLSLYIVFFVSLFDRPLYVLPAALVGSYISLNGFQAIGIVRFLKANPVEYLLAIAYIISGITIILSPFKPLLLLVPSVTAFLYRLLRRGAEGWR